MQHSPTIIFDRDFHLKQVNRHNKNFSSDIVIRTVSDIVCEKIDLLKETYKFVYDKPLAFNFYPSQLFATEHGGYDKPVQGEYDLIIANLSLHHENDVVGALVGYKEHLVEGGILIATLFGGSTLIELRKILEQTELELVNGASPRVIPMIDVKDAGRLVQLAKFKQVIADSEDIEVVYKDFDSQLNHPRKMAQSNCLIARNKSYVGREFFKVAAQKASQHFGPNDYTNTFEVISLTCIK